MYRSLPRKDVMICVDWDGVMKVYPTNAMELLSMEEEDGVAVLRKKL